MRPSAPALGALTLAAATSANAQIAPGQSGTSTMRYISGQLVFEELAEFGKCYASTSRADALKLVSTQAGTMDEAKTYRHLFQKPYQSCLGNVTELRVSHDLVRGAIAEGLYWKSAPVPANLAVAQVPSGAQARSLSEAAICYVGRHRATAQHLVEDTKPGTRNEFQAVTALWRDFSECVPPTAASSLRLDATLVRFRIAEALWRLGVGPGSAGATQ